MALLEVNNLAVSFQTPAGKAMAVNGVNLQVNAGEAVGIVGESGCGKSVTAHSIMQLVSIPPGRYERGEINFAGENLLLKTEAAMQGIRGREISMIFQDPMTSLNPVLTVGVQIAEVAIRHMRLSRGQAQERAIEMLRLVGIPSPEERVQNYPHQFSGGMRQRVMIAMALACQPKLLIADEPTTALDVTVQAQILDLLHNLKNRSHTAILMISHDLGVIAGLCSRVLVMYAGRIVEEGTAKDIFYRPRHPYTRLLLMSAPRLDAPPKTPLAAIAGQPPDLCQLPLGCEFHPRCPQAMIICTRQRPDRTEIAAGHCVTCWLTHPQVPGAAGKGTSDATGYDFRCS